MGKGSRQRPFDHKKFNDNWDRIFGKKKQEKSEQKQCDELMEKADIARGSNGIGDEEE